MRDGHELHAADDVKDAPPPVVSPGTATVDYDSGLIVPAGLPQPEPVKAAKHAPPADER